MQVRIAWGSGNKSVPVLKSGVDENFLVLGLLSQEKWQVVVRVSLSWRWFEDNLFTVKGLV